MITSSSPLYVSSHPRYFHAELPYQADNDFQTTNGVSVGQPYNAGLDADNQILVWRVTLPSVPRGQIEESFGKCT